MVHFCKYSHYYVNVLVPTKRRPGNEATNVRVVPGNVGSTDGLGSNTFG